MGRIFPSGGRSHVPLASAVFALLSLATLAQGQVQYRGSSVLLRRTSRISRSGGTLDFTLAAKDEVGFLRSTELCPLSNVQLDYSCSGGGGCCNEFIGPQSLDYCATFPNIMFVFRQGACTFAANAGQIIIARTVEGASGSSPPQGSTNTFSLFNPTDLTVNVLNQPPFVAMLPIVRIPAGSDFTLEIPIYDTDRFDTTSCEFADTFSIVSGITLQPHPCELTIASNVVPPEGDMQPVALVIKDTNANNVNMSEVSLRFTIEFVGNSGGSGAPICQTLTISGPFSEPGLNTLLPSPQATYNNPFFLSNETIDLQSSGTVVITPRGGQVEVRGSSGNGFRVVASFRGMNPLPLPFCFQYHGNVCSVSRVLCHSFLEGRAVFSRAAIVGTAGDTISVLLDVKQLATSPLNLVTTAITSNADISISRGSALSGSRRQEVIELSLPTVSSLEVGMLSISEIEGPEVLVYIYPVAAQPNSITISYLELENSTTGLFITIGACRCDALNISPVLYIASPVIDSDSATLERVEPFVNFFLIPVGMNCTNFTIPLQENIFDPANLAFTFDAEGPFIVATSSLSSGIMIAFQMPSINVNESDGIVIVNVCLNDGVPRTFPIIFDLSSEPDISGDIVVPSSGTIGAAMRCTVGASEVCATVSLSITDDNIAESTETFTITLVPTTPLVVADQAGNTLSVTIQDNDTLTIGFNQTQYFASPSQDVSVTVCTTSGDPSPVTVIFGVSSDRSISSNGIIRSGDVCGSARFTTSTQNFTVRLTSAMGLAISPNAAEADIILVSTVNLTFEETTVIEGSQFVFQVCLTVGSSGVIPPTVTVILQANSITTTANDFSGIPSTVTFSTALGNFCSSSNRIDAVRDSIDNEAPETFSVSIVNVSPPDLMIAPGITLRILQLNLMFDPAVYNVNEGGSFNLQICGSLMISTINTIDLLYDFSSTASMMDLITSGVSLPSSIMIPANTLCSSVSVPTIADGDPTDETFTISMTSATIGALGSPATVTIGVIGLVTSLSMTALNVVEGNSVTLQVCNNRLVNVPNQVSLNVNLLTGEAGQADFVDAGVTSGISVTIPANEMCAGFSIAIAVDSLVEGNEQFTISIAITSVGTPSTASTIVNIIDSTQGAATVNLTFEETTVVEGSEFLFQVCLTVGSSGVIPPTVTVNLQANSITTTTNDFTPVSGLNPINFNPTLNNPCSAINRIAAVADNFDNEAAETFSVSILSVLPANLMIAPGITLQILQLNLMFNPSTYNVDEGNSFILRICGTMMISTDNTIVLSFDFASSASTASMSDLITSGGSLPSSIMIPANTLCSSVSVPTIADGDPTDETFTISMTSATLGALGFPATVTIGVIGLVTSLSMTAFNVVEGNSVALQVCNNRLVNVPNQVSLNVNLLTGEAGQADFVNAGVTSGISVTIPANAMCAAFSIAIAVDSLVEGNEQFTISIAITSVGTPSAASTIVNIIDSTQGAATVNLTFEETTVVEGSEFLFQVCLTVGSSGVIPSTVTVNLQANSITTTTNDFTPVSGLNPINFNPTLNNPCSAINRIDAVADNFDNEAAETFSVSILSVSPSNLMIAPGITLQILQLNLMFSPSTYNVDEGDSFSLQICGTMTISTSNTIVLSFDFASLASTASMSDLITSGGSLPSSIVIPANTLCGSVSVPTIADRDPTDETFTISMTSATLGALGSPATVTIGVIALVTSISTTSLTVREGDSFDVEVCNNRLVNVDNQVVLIINFMAGVVLADFTTNVSSGITVTIPADQMCRSVTIMTASDSLNEGNELFTISISNTSVGTRSLASPTVTIMDVALAVLLRLQPLDAQFSESDPVGRINLVAEAPLAEDIFVNIGVTPITATSVSDFGLAPFVATLPAGVTTIPIDVLPVDDDIVELTEILEVFIVSATGDTRTVESMSTSTVSILDNDNSIISIIKSSSNPVNEVAGVATFMVCSELNLPAPVQITLDLRDGTALEGQDFRGPTSPTVTIPANQGDGACVPYSVAILDNAGLDDSVEDFTVFISSIQPPGVISTVPGEAAVTCSIIDDRLCDPSTSGNMFVLTLTPPYDSDDNFLYFVPASSVDVDVTVSVAGLFTDTFNVQQDASYTLMLPDSIAFPPNPPDTHTNVILVEATGPVNLYSQNRRQGGGIGDTTQIYPYRNLGNYYTVTVSPGPGVRSFVSIASRDANLVAITFSTEYNFAGIWYQPYETTVVTLNALEAIFLSSTSDLSGTRIFSRAPLFVLDGVVCNNIPNVNFGWCDLTMEQLLPALGVGTLSVVGPIPGRDAYTVHFTGIQDNTQVTFMDETILLNAGQQVRRFVYNDWRVYEIISDQPIYINQYVSSYTVDFETGDPAKLVLPPVSDFGGTVSFFVPDFGGQSAITIYVCCLARMGLLMDGNPITNFDYYVAEGCKWCSVSLENLGAGRHVVSHTDSTETFYVAVFNQQRFLHEGSAMSAGFNFGCGDSGCDCVALATDPCFDQPCMNGGICRQKVGGDGYFCRCTENFVGENCETVVRVCTVSNLYNYVNLDGGEYSISSNCRYTLFAIPTSQTVFNVLIWYNDCDGDIVLDLRITYGNYTIYLRPGHVIEVNDARAQFPISLQGVTITKVGEKLVVVLDDVRIVYGNSGSVEIQVPNRLASLTDGLCGNFNGLQDELNAFSQYGSGASIAFANSFIDQSLKTCVQPDPMNPPQNPTCTSANIGAAQTLCGIINDSNGPLSPCFNEVSETPFFITCVTEVCAAGATDACTYIERYVTACRRANVFLKDWRAAANCELTCTFGRFEDCLNPCPPTCYGLLTDTCECTEGSCFEGCQCPHGTYYSASGCLRPQECGCVAQGLYFETGEYYVDETCTRRCQCTGNNTFACEKYACHPNAICSNNFQRQSCVCTSGYSGDGEVCILDNIKGIKTITPCYGQQCDDFCLSSPNYGFGDYSDWETVLYVVGVPCATNIRVECNDIGTESGKDFLFIGPGADVPELVCVLRYDLPGILSLTGDTTLLGWDSNDWLLWMYFNTDRTTTSRGFQCCFYADDPCRDDPCMNGGICEKIPNLDFVCKCPRGYTGKRCEETVYYCGSYGDPHYFTFDGLFYDFQGTCEYYLVRNQIGIADPDIEITQSLERTDQRPEVTANERITIAIPGVTIVLGQGESVMVNGITTYLPYLPNDNLSIRKSGLFVVVRLTLTSSQGTADIEVRWNGNHFVEIAWPFTLQGLVIGLCGIPDGNISNDHQDMGGVNIPDDNAFASSFKVDPNCFDNPAILDPCNGGTSLSSPYANFFCEAAINTSVLGAFYQCSLSAPIDEFFSSCFYDGCATLPNQEYICDTISAAEHVCRSSGIRVGPWRSREICEPCCPPNSVFSECAPANPPTCVDPNPMCDRLCTAACVCNDGFLWENGQCIPEDQCGCFDETSGNYYPRGTVFLNSPCNQLTTCQPDGTLFTEPAACGPTELCSLVNGRPTCVCRAGMVSIGGSGCQTDPCATNPCNGGECLTRLNPLTTQVVFAGCRCLRGFTGELCGFGERICTAFGDPHYKTFDGRFFDFQGRCSYTLARNGCVLNNQNTFSISANNDLYAGGTTAIMAVTIEHEGDTVVLHRSGMVSINNIFVNLPAASSGGQIYRVGELVIMDTLDFRVEWNAPYNIDIKVSDTSSDICGLCGNNNGNMLDDLRAPNGTLVDETTFGNSWLSDANECDVLVDELPHPCGDVTDVLVMSRLIALCTGIQHGTQECNMTVNSQPYFEACLYDGCANPDDLTGPFSAYLAYLRECTGRQLLPSDWRFPEILDPSKNCPPNSYFAIDAPTCEPMCSNLASQPTPCQEKRAPGCRCMDGFVREGDRCIPQSECGCTDFQRYYPLGSQWLRPGCLEKCLCNLNALGVATVECVGHLCSGNALCDSRDGVRACVCLPGFHGNGLSCRATSCNPNPCQNGGTCQDMAFGNSRCVCPYGTFGEQCEENGGLCYIYGDPYFETFDGLAYNFQGVCEYSLVRACGTANIPFSITGTLESVASSPLSALSSVTIALSQPRQLTFQLTRSAVLLNGMAVNSLPYVSINDDVEIIYNGNELWFRSRYFNIRWDRYSKAVIAMRGQFRGSGICGMCGNFDNIQGNDLANPAGSLVSTPEQLGDSFRVNTCPLAVSAPTDPCTDSSYVNNVPLANAFCSMITDPFGPFVNCPMAIRNQAEMECRRDICLTGTIEKGCDVFDVLVDRCLNAIGGPPVNWRLDSNFACPDRCPAGSSFSNCVPACTPSCINSNMALLYECNYPCVPGCVCDRSDEIIQDGQCMSSGDCGCTDSNGNYYPLGATYLAGGCTMQCTCTVRGFPECVPFQCMTNAVCQTNPDQSQSCVCGSNFIQDGTDCVADPCSARNCNSGECFSFGQVTLCVCPEGFSGVDCEIQLTSCYSYGDPHFDTFDGRPYDYNGACSYLLVRSISGMPFSIVQHNERVPGQAASIIRGLTATFPGLPDEVINIDGDGIVSDQNGIFYTLPWQFHDSILVETDFISVAVKTTFGLKLTWYYRERVIKVSLTDDFFNAIEGLCGNFNGDLTDDLQEPLTVNQFGDRWHQPNFPCDESGLESGNPTPQLSPCASAGAQLASQAELRCSVIPIGNLASCPAAAVAIAAVACRSDICTKQGASRTECSAFTYAAQSCIGLDFDVGDWRNGRCEIDCPGMSEYSTTAEGCPRTCFDLVTNAQSLCTKGPREGCQCPDGYYWSGNECVLPANCGCVENGVYFTLGESFFTDNCQMQCSCTTTGVTCQAVQCSASGSCMTGANGRPMCVCNPGLDGDGINCNSAVCPNDCGVGVCGDQNGRPGCICPEPYYGPTCSRTRSACSFRGDPHYQTLDGRRFDFQGECFYTMLSFDFSPVLMIVTGNEAFGTTDAAMTREVVVRFRPDTLNEETIMLLQGREVMVDGQFVVPPFRGQDYDIVDSAGIVRIITNFGVEIEWNGIYDGVIYVDDMYQNDNLSIRGLCGTFNNNSGDDFHNIFGVSVSPERAFGDAWQNREFGPLCEPMFGVHPCDTNLALRDRAEEICGIITDQDGPFAQCIVGLGQLEVMAIYRNCFFDICVSLPDETDPKVCGTITAFAQQCQRANIVISNWRASLNPPNLCDPVCPGGSVFSDCTSVCPLTCRDVTLGNSADPICTTPCQEGCECLPGLVWQGGTCVPMDQCGCFDIYNSQFYALGQSFLRRGCNEWCICQAGGQFNCSEADCHCEAECVLVERAYQCVCPENFFGDGFSCSIDPCLLNNPCGIDATCQSTAAGETYCVCPMPGQFGNNCQFSSSECWAIEGEMFVTYDGETATFYGQCTIVLTATTDPNAANAFRVEITLSNDPSLTQSQSGNQISSILVTAGNQNVEVIRISSPVPTFMIDGKEYGLTVLGNMDIIAWRTLDRVIVFLLRGVIISFTQSSVQVTVSSTYAGELTGICGNNDGMPNDTPVVVTEVTPCPAAGMIRPCNEINTSDMDTVNNRCEQIIQNPESLDCLSTLLMQCRDVGCANFPDPTAICAFMDIAGKVCNPTSMPGDIEFCDTDCGPFAEFSSNITACQRTCGNSFPLSFCPVTTMAGCQCQEGRILNSVGDCVLPHQCGCLQLGVYYEPGAMYYTPNCEKLCTCRSGGLSECDYTNGCPESATCVSLVPLTFECQCQNGSRLENNQCIPDPCVPNLCENGGDCTRLSETAFECCCPPGFDGMLCDITLGVCQIYGNPIIDTFDGLNYHFIGGGDSCEYRLATSSGCGTGPNPIMDFSLMASFIRGSSSTSALLGSITLTISSTQVIQIRTGGILLLNQLQVFPPVTVTVSVSPPSSVLITGVYDNIIIHTDFGLNIVWKEGYVYVYLDPAYRSNTCGLCGNFDGDPNNDNTHATSNMIVAVHLFGDSHETSGCGLISPDPQSGMSGRSTEAERLCSLFQDLSGPFADCIRANTDIAESFYDSCRNYQSESLSLRRSLCDTYQAYAHYCRNNGLRVFDWRATLNTNEGSVICSPFTCPVGSTYTDRMISCPPTCTLDPNIDRKRDCLQVYLEGCRCDSGRLLENDRCLLPEDCGCTYMNTYLTVGSSVLDPQCQQTITCPPNNNGNIAVDPFICPVAGDCIIEASVLVCQCRAGDILLDGVCYVDPCRSDPCNSRGRCVVTDVSQGGFYCVCDPDFTGQLCQADAAQCSVYGDPNFLTFDMESFEFLASVCEYLLVENLAAAANGASISITTEESVVSALTRVNRVIISEGTQVIEFLVANGAITILVNGLLVTQPTGMTVSTVGQIYNGGPFSSVTYVSNDLGYKVRVSTESGVDVKYPTSGSGNILNGLCGNANGVPALTGATQAMINDFGDDHRVQPCSAAPTSAPANNCTPPDDGPCNLIISSMNSPSILADCFSTVDPLRFYENCRKDLCTSNDPNKACAVVASYAQWCRDSGIMVENWREVTNCEVVCPQNSVYDFNAPANPPSCVSPNPPQDINPLPDVEACTCRPGFLLEGDQCIPEGNCGCMFNGVYFRRGQTVLFDSCTTSCTCPDTGVFNNTNDCMTGISCHANASCRIENNEQTCVCGTGFEGTGFDCYRPGCANSPCLNGGTCETRPRPGAPNNPDFYCVCPSGFIGQNCSQQVDSGVTEQFVPRSFLVTSQNNGNTYQSNQDSFTQIYCPGGTYLVMDIPLFITESFEDILFFGTGFVEASLQELKQIAADVSIPLPPGVEALTGILSFNTSTFATDAIWFYFTSDDQFNLRGFEINVTCMSEPIPPGTEGNCFNGQTTIRNEVSFVLTACERCICEDGVITCVITDQTALTNALDSVPINNFVRGMQCTQDSDCASLLGSTCTLPTCLSSGGCPAITTSVCSSGNSLQFCREDDLCRQYNLEFSEELANVDVNSTFGTCENVIKILEASNPCFVYECRFPEKRKRAVDPVGRVEIKVGAKSRIRSRAELEADMKEFDESFPRYAAEIMEKYKFVTNIELVGFESEDPLIRPTVRNIHIVETNNADNDDTSLWTYLLTALAVILLIISIGLTITIFKYYKKQTNSLNAKFKPASPRYPTDNLPESLEMVKSETRKNDSIFARRIPLDDNTGNTDNIFALSWTREEDGEEIDPAEESNS